MWDGCGAVLCRYAPAAVRAAVEAQQNPDFDAPMPPTAGGMGGGMGGGMASNLQQSYSPSAPVMAEPPAPAPASDNVFSGGNNAFNNRYTPSVGNAIGSSDLLVQVREGETCGLAERKAGFLDAIAVGCNLGPRAWLPVSHSNQASHCCCGAPLLTCPFCWCSLCA